jgi:hypothetical protein
MLASFVGFIGQISDLICYFYGGKCHIRKKHELLNERMEKKKKIQFSIDGLDGYYTSKLRILS